MSSNTYGGFTGSGPLGRSGRGEPPILAEYPDEPQYDLATVVQLVGVRPMTLWAWEQQLNIPKPQRVGDGTGGTVRHYSERDLVASIWLRDQILAGLTPAEAADRLIAAQPPQSDVPGSAGAAGASDASGPVARPVVTSGPLSQQPMIGRSTSTLGRFASGPATGPMTGGPTGSIMRGELTGPLRGGYGVQGATGAPAPRSGSLSGPLSAGRNSGSLNGPPTGTWSGQSGVYSSPVPGSMSGPLRTTGGPITGQRVGPGASGGRWLMPPGATARELRSFVPQLIRAWVTFDTHTANRLVDEALAVRSVESVAVGLLQPALTRANELWARHEMTIPEERYAVNFVRMRLFSIFATTVERFDGPIAIVACGPREMHDIGALMLATFWRRAGLRVVFLGQDVDGPSLVHDVNMRRPRLVCVSIMTPQRVRALARIAKDIVHMDAPTPIFTYSGAVFARNPELQRKVSGVYLGDDPATATWHAMRLLGMEPGGNGGGNPPQTTMGPMGQVG